MPLERIIRQETLWNQQVDGLNTRRTGSLRFLAESGLHSGLLQRRLFFHNNRLPLNLSSSPPHAGQQDPILALSAGAEAEVTAERSLHRIGVSIKDAGKH